MRTSTSYITITLAILGLIPFVFASYLSWSGDLFWNTSGLHLFITYSAIILSFMAGTLWGQRIHKDMGRLSTYVLISSNVIAFGTWLSLLIKEPNLSIGLLILGFISTFWVETKLLKQEETSDARYSNTRFMLTIFVCVLHLFVLYPHH